MLSKMVHVKCTNSQYPLSLIFRFILQDFEIPWSYPLSNYDPPIYTSPTLEFKPWADPQIGDAKFSPKWNQLDGNVNRVSHMGDYAVVEGFPRNPEGRTGLYGRGSLGKWGPNHAADPIVTRWKRLDGQIVQHKKTKLPILQFCAIQRHDVDEWAIPGGMVDPGENVTQTLVREFMEEAMNSLESKPDKLAKNKQIIENFFKNGEEIYRGYVDDPRNTDNAWMETVAYNFHDETGDAIGKIKLNAGDDAKSVKWLDVNGKLALYASHADLIHKVVKLRKAHW